jgi:hypothetical protein
VPEALVPLSVYLDLARAERWWGRVFGLMMRGLLAIFAQPVRSRATVIWAEGSANTDTSSRTLAGSASTPAFARCSFGASTGVEKTAMKVAATHLPPLNND